MRVSPAGPAGWASTCSPPRTRPPTRRRSQPPTRCSSCGSTQSARRTGRSSTRSAPDARCSRHGSGRSQSSPARPRTTALPRPTVSAAGCWRSATQASARAGPGTPPSADGPWAAIASAPSTRFASRRCSVSDVLLSVVVCTHDRPADLVRCLGALARLEDPVEVIVVDSASRKPCRELAERFASAFGAMSVVRTSVPGLSRARNAGLEAAASPIVAFVDDDAEPAPTWARTIARPFAEARVACVGGTCRPVFDARRPRWLSGRLLQFAGITRFGGTARESRSSAEYPFGANMAFRRADLLAVGGFPENLGRVGTTLLSGEEYEVIERLRTRGSVVWLEPGAIVDHHVAPERCRSSYYWRRLWWQGVSRARGRRSVPVALRLACAAPIRLVLWPLARDRVYLYRIAETAGYLAECLRARGAPA